MITWKELTQNELKALQNFGNGSTPTDELNSLLRKRLLGWEINYDTHKVILTDAGRAVLAQAELATARKQVTALTGALAEAEGQATWDEYQTDEGLNVSYEVYVEAEESNGRKPITKSKWMLKVITAMTKQVTQNIGLRDKLEQRALALEVAIIPFMNLYMDWKSENLERSENDFVDIVSYIGSFSDEEALLGVFEKAYKIFQHERQIKPVGSQP